MSVFSLLNRRLVGFRVIELVATLLLTAMVITVYLAKTGAGDKTDDIDRITQQIQDTDIQIHLLNAQVANLERPDRLGRLAAERNLQPISPRQEIDADALADIAQAHAPAQPQAQPQAQPVAAPIAPPPSPLEPANYAVPPAAAAAPTALAAQGGR